MNHEIKKIFFVGLGGAGQRHLRIFNELLPYDVEFSAYRNLNKTPLLKSDFSIDERETLDTKYSLKLFNSLEKGLANSPDLIVISTPSSLHMEVAKKAAEKNTHLFVEKPFSHTLEHFDEFREIVLKNDLFFFVSFQRRFHPFFKQTKEFLSRNRIGNVISAVFNVGSYVPDWHPYENYEDLYACRKELGGGVLLTEIHEIDLCYWFFGLPNYIYCTGGNYSRKDIDVEDTAHLTLKYSAFSVQINLCFMQKYNRRDFYICGTDGYIEWEGRNNTHTIIDYQTDKKEITSDKEYSNEAMFVAQASYFLEDFSRTDKSYLDIAQASTAIVEAAKKSMVTGKEIALP